MLKVVNLARTFDRFEDIFAPKIVSELNGQHVKLVKCEGDLVPWHTHDAEDELFLVLSGELDILTREETVTVRSGEFTVVPRGVEHKARPRGHVELLLFEPVTIAQTGGVRTEITRDELERLE